MGYSSAQAKEFIKHIAPMIQSEAKNRGYKICSTVIAQAIIEGAAGTSSLAKIYHNHFGMKCGKSWLKHGLPSVNLKTKEEYVKGELTDIDAWFRVYSSDEQCVIGYYEFIGADRYENLKDATTYKEYAQMLKDDGYATSSTYVNTLCSTVEKYKLYNYDPEDTQQHIQSRRIIKLTNPMMSGSDVIIIQQILQKLCYNIGRTGVDGKYGPNTKTAVMQFQNDRGLKVDGIVGPKTWVMLEKYN